MKGGRLSRKAYRKKALKCNKRQGPSCYNRDGRRKYRYSSLALAERFAASGGLMQYALRPYLCPDCRFWHLTERPEPGN